MKIVVVDLDGINNGAVIKTLLASKFPSAEIKAAAASEKQAGKKTTRLIKTTAKSVLGLEVEGIVSEPITADIINSADKIIVENKNNINLIQRRLGKEALKDKAVVELGIKSGHGLKGEVLENNLKSLVEKTSSIQL